MKPVTVIMGAFSSIWMVTGAVIPPSILPINSALS
jgi:hypothetical protein